MPVLCLLSLFSIFYTFFFKCLYLIGLVFFNHLVFIFYLSNTLKDLYVFIDVTFACLDAFSLMSKCRAPLCLANHALPYRFYVPA